MFNTVTLQESIVYGPVIGRRLNRSLGLNVMPINYKVCSFNCVYCHYSWTKCLKTEVSEFVDDLPTVEQIQSELEKTLRIIEPPDHITFSGNGEPTLHPDFPAIVDQVLAVRDRLKSPAKVAIFSNSTGLGNHRVREALQKLDLRLMKLDAGSPEILRKINRPAPGISFDGIVEDLRQLEEITLQSAFVDGKITNSTEEAIEVWLACVKQIRPAFVQVYSLQHAPAMRTLVGVPLSKLEEIARRVERLGIKAAAY